MMDEGSMTSTLAPIEKEEQNDAKHDDLCLVEASVVTGFEECARGEAKEKFCTDVKAARGRISWKMPVENVKDVVKLGAIDNVRVVLFKVPHFKFTDSADDCLARLQKTVPEYDWDLGLRVWRKYFDFPHPVTSKPDIISSLEDLVDVVIMPPRTHPKSENDKKGGKGNKKARKWGKGKGGKKAGKGEQEAEKSKVPGEKVEEGEGESVDVRSPGEGEESVTHQLDTGGGDMKATDKIIDKAVDMDKEDAKNVLGDNAQPFVSESQSKETEVSKELNQKCSIKSPKTVIIKKADPNREEVKIEIKVLDHGLNANVFPSEVENQDHSDEEPMDIDQSMNKSALIVSQPVKTEALTTEADQTLESDEPPQTRLSLSSAVDASEFASIVIEKLNSPKSSPDREDPTGSISPNKSLCATPPTTPVRHLDNLVFAPNSPPTNMFDPTSRLSPTNKTEAMTRPEPEGESSVDPPLQQSLKPSQPVMNMMEADSISTEVLSDTQKAATSPVKKERDPTKPTFRVTCNRMGDNHKFDSGSAAASLGSAIITYFGWSVDLKNHDIEVILNIDHEEVSVCIALTKASLHNRNLVAFGPTTLRATIAYNMLRLCRIKNGDFICDPMCGTSAIPIESALNWPNCYHFGGDFHEKAMERSYKNITAIQDKLQAEEKSTMKVDTIQWDVNHFPLRDKCVDIFVSDLPFGYRMGSRSVNKTLYPCLLSEMARSARSGARACLLTEDKTNLIKAIQTMGNYWQRRLVLNINMGGLSAFVFLLTRTAAAMAPKAWIIESDDSMVVPDSNLSTQNNEDNTNDDFVSVCDVLHDSQETNSETKDEQTVAQETSQGEGEKTV